MVYSKSTLEHEDTVVRYLARYCNRVGVSNSRLSLSNHHRVTLRYKNYRNQQQAQLQCSTAELVRRFVLHVLPKGFVRIRYYGFMANAVRRKTLGLIRAALSAAKPEPEQVKETVGPECPQCHVAGMLLMAVCLPARRGMMMRTG